MYLATKIILGLAFLGLGVAIINFVMTLARRRKESKEVMEMQELKDKEEELERLE